MRLSIRLQKKSLDSAELVDIPEDSKGRVIGKGGETLNEISTRTGAHLYRKRGNVFMSGSEEARQKARLEIKFIVVSSCCKN